MQNDQIIALIHSVLEDPNFMQLVFQNVYAYDRSIGIAIQWDYNIVPKLILPVGGNETIVYAMVAFDTTRGEIERSYSGMISLSETQSTFQILYPGSSNADFHLFRDAYPAALGTAGEGALLANTELTSEISPTGWSERWTFLLPDGSESTKDVDFTTDPTGGTFWTLR